MLNSEEGQETPAYLHAQQKNQIRIKTKLQNLGDFLFKTNTQEQAGSCIWILGATYRTNTNALILGVRESHKEVQRQVKEICRIFTKAKAPK